MECGTKDELEQHLSDIRSLAVTKGLTSEQTTAAARAERFAIALVREHDSTGHKGKRCPYATRVSPSLEG
jgi:hypothetical protein